MVLGCQRPVHFNGGGRNEAVEWVSMLPIERRRIGHNCVRQRCRKRLPFGQEHIYVRHNSLAIKKLVWSGCYEPWRRKRDQRIEHFLRGRGMQFDSFKAHWSTTKPGGTFLPYLAFPHFSLSIR